MKLPSVSMSLEIEYLLQFLKDELKDIPDLRIHPVAPSGTKKSPDLPQDYDPNENSLHLERGVRIRVGSRDYFFPIEWVKNHRMELIQSQANEIRAFALG